MFERHEDCDKECRKKYAFLETMSENQVVFLDAALFPSNTRTVMKIKTLQEKEYDLIKKVLTQTEWNFEKASRLLQIPISQLKRKIKKHGMKKEAADTFLTPGTDLE